MSGDNFKPRSLADSLFNDFDDIGTLKCMKNFRNKVLSIRKGWME